MYVVGAELTCEVRLLGITFVVVGVTTLVVGLLTFGDEEYTLVSIEETIVVGTDTLDDGAVLPEADE